MKSRCHKEKGFTLLELIIVLAVIGVIAAIAIPQYSIYREKAERKAIVSECREIYRAFVIYYLEWMEYPLASVASPGKPPVFDLTTLSPLTVPQHMGEVDIAIDESLFLKRFVGDKAEKFDSPDDMGSNQEFYLVLAWKQDPSIKYVIASSDAVKYNDGTIVDGGNWLDGVFITKNGNIISY